MLRFTMLWVIYKKLTTNFALQKAGRQSLTLALESTVFKMPHLFFNVMVTENELHILSVHPAFTSCLHILPSYPAFISCLHILPSHPAFTSCLYILSHDNNLYTEWQVQFGASSYSLRSFRRVPCWENLNSNCDMREIIYFRYRLQLYSEINIREINIREIKFF